MESGCSPSIRRPRSCSNRKPRLGSHFLFDLDNAIRLDTSGEKDVLNASLHFKKGAFLQEIFVVSNHCKNEVSRDGSSIDNRAHKATSKAKESIENQKFKALHRGNRQGALYDSAYECHQDTRKTLQESNEGIAPGGHHLYGVNTKDVSQLVRETHDDNVICEPGSLKRTQSHRKRVVPRKYHDSNTAKDRCVGQKDGAYTSASSNNSRKVCMKYNVEWRKSELVSPPRGKLHTKCLENKVIKNQTSTKADVTGNYPDDYTYLIQELDKKSTSKDSSCVLDSRRRQHSTHSQEKLSDKTDSQICGDISSSEDAVSVSNGQSSSEVERSVLVNCGAANRGASNVNGITEFSNVRKSSRIPKKRILDGDEEAPLRRSRKKLEIEEAIEYSEQEKRTDDAGNVQLAKELYERDSMNVVRDGEFAHDRCIRDFLNSNEMAEPFLVEKKELPLTARQRALRISKEGGDHLEGNIGVGFPDVSQRVVPKRQKENLSEAEQAIKKEEAARRRKEQMEKNAKEIQEVAIQKILGQESSRKKREEKLQKQRQEIEQEKQAAAMAPAVNSIRWVMGPSGNVVSFSQDVELPKIFSGPCSYPQEREKCAGPSCNNAYKYRDSKTRLPLCSLQCYRAVQELPSIGPAFKCHPIV